MEDLSLKDLEILDNIKFMIKYCDTFLDYCHEENLSVDGNIAGEIVDSIIEIESYLEKPDESLDEDSLKDIYQRLEDINDGLLNFNDIKIFNDIHIVYTNVLKETKELILKQVDIDFEYLEEE
jgi:regulator of sigma D